MPSPRWCDGATAQEAVAAARDRFGAGVQVSVAPVRLGGLGGFFAKEQFRAFVVDPDAAPLPEEVTRPDTAPEPEDVPDRVAEALALLSAYPEVTASSSADLEEEPAPTAAAPSAPPSAFLSALAQVQMTPTVTGAVARATGTRPTAAPSAEPTHDVSTSVVATPDAVAPAVPGAAVVPAVPEAAVAPPAQPGPEARPVARQWEAPRVAAPQWEPRRVPAPQWDAPQVPGPQWQAPQVPAPQWQAPQVPAPQPEARPAAAWQPEPPRVAAPEPAPADHWSQTVADLGVPADLVTPELLDRIRAHGAHAAFTHMFRQRIPEAPCPTPAPGQVVVVVGIGPDALTGARHLAEAVGLDPDRTLVTPTAGGPSYGPPDCVVAEQIPLRAAAARDSATTTIVAVDVPLPRERGSVPAAVRAITDWAPTTVWAAVDSTRHGRDLARWADALPALSGVVALNVEYADAPASALACRAPVALLGVRKATPARWASVLCERLAEDDRDHQ